MQCTIRYLEWHASWWLAKVGARSDADQGLRSGLDGYARRQAFVRQEQARTFVEKWQVVLARAGLDDPWLTARYSKSSFLAPQGDRHADDNGKSDNDSDDGSDGSDDGFDGMDTDFDDDM